jgi:hypothetical protein
MLHSRMTVLLHKSSLLYLTNVAITESSVITKLTVQVIIFIMHDCYKTTKLSGMSSEDAELFSFQLLKVHNYWFPTCGWRSLWFNQLIPNFGKKMSKLLRTRAKIISYSLNEEIMYFYFLFEFLIKCLRKISVFDKKVNKVRTFK